jgi:PAS domain S-box-containing protein
MITYTEVTTERKLAEKALRESENKYRGLFESLVDGVAESDLEGTIISCNRAYQEMTGHTEAELKKLKYQDLTPAKWREVDKAHIEQAMQRGYSDQYEKERLRRDGTTFPISMRIWLKRNSKGEPVGFWGIIRDISERVRAQEERDKLQNQLYQAQKMESIGRLAGGVAHDLNNLLSPILGYGEMLLDDTAPSDPRREPLEEVVSAGKRAQTLVRQLLAFSRKQPLQFQAVDMNRLIGDFKKLLRRTVREDIRIRTKLSRSIPQVKGDIGQIEQVIMNLAVNAQDAMPEGGTLTLETSAVELDAAYAGRKKGVTPGAYVRVAISDTGTGMDDETLEHLFEPFFTTKETGKGTGLGLSTAYGIIKQHGGNIWAYSEPGLGTTIKLYLPVPEADFESEASLPQAAKNTKGSEVLLLVEDDRQVRNLSSVILQRQGYKVLPAPNGKEALCLLEEHKDRIDLLLTDVIMPDMNGKELFEKVSALHPGVRVLYMSGYTDDVIAHHGVIDAGVNFIEKPFTVKALAAKVREVLEG